MIPMVDARTPPVVVDTNLIIQNKMYSLNRVFHYRIKRKNALLSQHLTRYHCFRFSINSSVAGIFISQGKLSHPNTLGCFLWSEETNKTMRTGDKQNNERLHYAIHMVLPIKIHV